YIHHSTPSIGAALIDVTEASVDELLKRADLAMYQAKEAGRNTLRFFDPEMQTAFDLRTRMEAQLREGLRAGQFVLHYQPQVDDAGQMIGAEALVRWSHPERGLLSPATFIHLAEESGLILQLGEWVLQAACAQLAAWSQHGSCAERTLAINISARQFREPHFVGMVRTALDRYGIRPHRLKLELTESLLLEDVEDTIHKMAALRELGLRFALDDFGTGYSSLSYLKRLPLDELKIDRSFVDEVTTDANDAAIVRAVLALAPQLGLSVIAEGVETDAQRRFLISNGCHAFQGYLFGRPGPADALNENA
ncbi:MAG: EAL domain-containing protein, partial [Gammaproteobacteria bacterium]|nr:EAL domain-containing protein [Gammaproteobacteria bacterium]